ncbi:sulfotransferase family 2 domain-containing protein [Jannaschia seosinensis]|nr:sulfotransferase family 2 domain-containing protein [Jannaschia seosinensis]
MLRHPRNAKTALEKNAAHRFAATQALVCYPTDTVYTFIPKNACSTLRLSLAAANGCVAGPEDWTWIHPNNRTFSATLRELLTARFTFVILRCPHARLASVFLDKIVSKTTEFWDLYRLENDGLDEFRTTFRRFVATIEKPKNLRANIHWRPQEEFLVYERYDAYFQMERFGDAVPQIEQQGGIALIDARPLTRHGTERFDLVSDLCYADTPLAELAEMKRQGKAPAHAALYDDRLAARVARIYAADLALYSGLFGTPDLLFPAAAGHERR